MTLLLAALHSAAGTFHSAAAAAISISRAMAPPSRTYWLLSRMPRLPPVEKFFQTRLRRTFSPGVGYSVVTFDPVALELLGDELGEAGQRALAHLGAGDADHHLVVGMDHHPGVELLHLGRLRPTPKGRRSRARSRRRRRWRWRGSRDGRETGEVWIVMMRLPLMPWPRRGSPRAPAGRCRSGRCWSWPRRCRRRSDWAWRRAARWPP